MGAAELRPVSSSPSSLPTCKRPVTFPWAGRSGRRVPASHKCRAEVGSRLTPRDPAWRLLCSRGRGEVSAGREGTGSVAGFLVKGNKKQRAGRSCQPVGSSNDINNNNQSLFPGRPCGVEQPEQTLRVQSPAARALRAALPAGFSWVHPLPALVGPTERSARAAKPAWEAADARRVPEPESQPGQQACLLQRGVLQRATRRRRPGSRQPVLVEQPPVTAATH